MIIKVFIQLGHAFLVLLLVRDTDGSALAASGLSVLTADTHAPPVAHTTVATDLLQTFNIFTQLGVDGVGNNLTVSTVTVILLSVQEPVGDLVVLGVLDDLDDAINFISLQFTSTTNENII